MKKMNNYDYLNEHKDNQNDRSGAYRYEGRYEPEFERYQLRAAQPSGNGFMKLLLAVALVALAGMGGMLIGEKNAANTAPSDSRPVIETPVYVTSEKEVVDIEKPIKDLPSYQGNFFDVFTQMNGVIDNFGEVYDKAYVANIGINACSSKLSYKLNDDFTAIRGTVSLLEEDKDDINVFQVCVYDGNGNCIYESEMMERDNPDPIEIDCDITGLDRVAIVLEGCDRQCGRIKVLMPKPFAFVKAGEVNA